MKFPYQILGACQLCKGKVTLLSGFERSGLIDKIFVRIYSQLNLNRLGVNFARAQLLWVRQGYIRTVRPVCAFEM